MIKKTLYFGNPVYLSLKNAQLMIKLPEVVRNDTLPESFKRTSEVTKPIEDIGVVVLDSRSPSLRACWKLYLKIIVLSLHVTVKVCRLV